MCNFYHGFKSIPFAVNLFLHPCKRYGFAAKHPELLRSNIALRFKKWIEYSDKGSSLSGEIMKLEHLKTCKARSAESCLYICLITQNLELA